MLAKLLCLIGFHKWMQISDIVINTAASAWGDGYYDAPHYWKEKCERCNKERVGY